MHTLQELSQVNLLDFGIYLQLEPDEEQKAMLEQNIQVALQQNQIYLEDAIDIREVKNLKLANALLKQRRKKKLKQDQAAQQANIQAQAQANAEQAERAAMNEVQKQQAVAETNIQFEQAKSQFEIQRMEQEAVIKKQLMEQKFQYDMQLAQADIQVTAAREKEIEDRKDKRTKLQATQQSQMISQRQNDLLPTNFETEGDNEAGGFGLQNMGPG